MAGNFLSWESPGAPALLDSTEDIFNILDFCLINNGNWTKPFTRAGDTQLYQIAPGIIGHDYGLSLTSLASGSVGEATGIRTPDSLTTGLDTFARASGPVYFPMRANSATATNPDVAGGGTGIGRWYMYYDDWFFQFYVQTSNLKELATFEFGVPVLIDAGDDFACIVTGGRDTTPSSSDSISFRFSSSTSRADYGGWCRSRNGSVVNQAWGQATSLQLPGSLTAVTPSEDYSGGTVAGNLVSPVYYFDAGNSNVERVRRAYRPGTQVLFAPQPMGADDVMVEFAGSGDLAGKTFYQLRGSISQVMAVCLDTELWGR